MWCSIGITHSYLEGLSISSSFLRFLSPPLHPNLFYGATLSNWLRLNSISHQTSTSGIRWGIVFSFDSEVWLQQNWVIFRDHITHSSLMTEMLAKAFEFAYLGLNDRVRPSVISIKVWWSPPPKSWFKLNSDGSSLGNIGRAGGGGIIWKLSWGLGKWLCHNNWIHH